MSPISSFNVSLGLTSKYMCMIPLFPWAERQQNRGPGLWLQMFILPIEPWGTMKTIYLIYLFNKSGIAVLVKMSSWQHYLALCRANECLTSALLFSSFFFGFCIPFWRSRSERHSSFPNFALQPCISVVWYLAGKIYCYPSLALSGCLSVTAGLTSQFLKHSPPH